MGIIYCKSAVYKLFQNSNYFASMEKLGKTMEG